MMPSRLSLRHSIDGMHGARPQHGGQSRTVFSFDKIPIDPPRRHHIFDLGTALRDIGNELELTLTVRPAPWSASLCDRSSRATRGSDDAMICQSKAGSKTGRLNYSNPGRGTQ